MLLHKLPVYDESSNQHNMGDNLNYEEEINPLPCFLLTKELNYFASLPPTLLFPAGKFGAFDDVALH